MFQVLVHYFGDGCAIFFCGGTNFGIFFAVTEDKVSNTLFSRIAR